MQIKDLPASTTLASTDVLAKDTSSGTTQKITGGNLASQIKSLGSLLGTSDVVNDLTSGGATVPLSAEQGKVLNGKISSAAIRLIRRMDDTTVSLTAGYNAVPLDANANVTDENFVGHILLRAWPRATWTNGFATVATARSKNEIGLYAGSAQNFGLTIYTAVKII